MNQVFPQAAERVKPGFLCPAKVNLFFRRLVRDVEVGQEPKVIASRAHRQVHTCRKHHHMSFVFLGNHI